MERSSANAQPMKMRWRMTNIEEVIIVEVQPGLRAA